MKFRLIVAGVGTVLWTGLGLVILIQDPPGMRLSLGGGTISSGWAVLVLALYNLLRFLYFLVQSWNVRSLRRLEAEEAARRSRSDLDSEETETEPNPDFLFDKPSSSPGKSSPPSDS